MNQLIATDVKMTSLDIAEVTGKKHQHVMRDIRLEIEELGEEVSQSIFGQSTYINGRGREYPCYQFGKDGAMQLALKYDAKTRYNVIKYVDELENKPQLPMNNTKLLLETALQHEERIDNMESDVSMLKDTMRISSRQEMIINNNARRVVISALGGKKSKAYGTMNRKAFGRFWGEFKRYFEVARYGDIPKKHFDEAIEWINEWQPDTTTRMEIRAENAQMSSDEL